MLDEQESRMRAAIEEAQSEAIAAVVGLARDWARLMDGVTTYDGPAAMRIFANTIEKQWAKSGAGVGHAVE